MQKQPPHKSHSTLYNHHTFKTIFSALFTVSALQQGILFANENDILSSISSDMSHYRDVATATKSNELYQPYIISVFKGKELEKLGIKDLEEALVLAPGVDIATDNFNNRTMIFRGSNPQAYGQTKLFIDGTLVNEVFFDSYTQYLKMPIEMIKRIEITRGPGSKSDGVNAYAGSIHVITYSEEFEGFESKDKVLIKGGSYDYKMGGFVKNYRSGDLKIFTDFYYQEDDKRLYAGPDGITQGQLSILPIHDNRQLGADGDAPVWLKNWNLGLYVDYKEFYVKARNNDYTHGSAYGVNWYLPNDDDRQKLPSQYVEIGYNTTVEDFSLNLSAGVKNDAWDSDAQLAPDGLSLINIYKYKTDPTNFDWADPADTNVTFNDGIHGIHIAKQRTDYYSAFLTYRGWRDHTLKLGYRFSREKTYEMVSKLSDRESGDYALTDYTDTFPFFDKNAFRETSIYSLQDSYYVNDAVSLIYGFSQEDTTYTDPIIDPRVSLVYQHNANNIYKLIYSQSHRNPSWQEMFTQNNSSRAGTTDLDPEKVSAYEAAYIRKFSTDSYFQGNIFKLENKDQIYSSTPPTFRNELDTTIYGIELEYKANLTSSDQFYLNYAYVDGEDSNGNSLTNVAKNMAKLYYIYDLDEALSLSTILKHVGSKERAAGDTRDPVDAYTKVDLAVRYNDRRNDFYLTLSGKNIFDADIRYPSPPSSYIEDYRQEGRTFLITLGKEY